MKINPKDGDKAFLGILVTILLIVSVFSVGIAASSTETEDEKIELLVYKRGIDHENLEAREGYSVLENYDSFVLVETTEENKLALEGQGHLVESLRNRDYVGLHSYSFYTDEGEPEIPDDLRIEGYPEGETGYYILQFRGPIKAEWQEQLESSGVELHQFRHRFNYIVEMDQETRRRVEEFDFVEWTGIYQPAYRFDKELLERADPIHLDVSLFDGADAGVIANGIATIGGNVQYIGEDRVSVEVEDPERIINLATLDGVRSITERSEGYHLFNERSTWVTQTNEEDNRKVTEEGVTGEGELITVMDSGLNPEHEAFEDPGNSIGDDHRKVQARYVPEGAEGDIEEGHMHGTHVSGTVLGESPPYGEYSNHDGNALEARLIFQDVSEDGQSVIAPEDMYDNAYGDAYERGSRVHTNSWGGRGSGDYTEFTEETDEFIWDHKDFNVLFAVGNDGPEADTISPQAAGKNVIGVGAAEGGADSRGGQANVADLSSRGYTTDGRIKPDIMHIGEGVMSADDQDETGYTGATGTSMSTPGIAGQVGQVRDYYKSGWYPTGTPVEEDGFNPSNALVRATLINGAVEMTGDGSHENDARFPNNDQGFGRSKLDRVMHFEEDDRNLKAYDSSEEDESLDTGESWNTRFYVDDASEDLEITLAWTDYPGSPGADTSNPAIVNDLDLEVEGPEGNRYVGNAFTDHDPGYSEPDPEENHWSGLREDDEFDGLNVIENVLLLPDENGLEEGTYEVTVRGHNVPEGPQPFAVVISGGFEDVEPPSITIQRPTGGETWEDEDVEAINWFTEDGDAPTETVDLDYRRDDDDSWKNIAKDLPDDGSYDWTVPDEWTEEARIRATVYDQEDYSARDISDQFRIKGSRPPSISITRPGGGEMWAPGSEEDIEWNTEEGDGDITVVDLEYSVDDGDTWMDIRGGLEDTGSYTWTVPDDITTEARVRATVHDVNGRSHEDVSDPFTIGTVEYTLTIDTIGMGNTDPTEGTHTYVEDEEVDVEATPSEGWYFEEWRGDVPAGEEGKEITITIDEDKEITAVFEEEEPPETYELTIDVEGEGVVHVHPDQEEYEEGTDVNLLAEPNDGWYFDGWTGDVLDPEEQITVTMDEDKEITANFEVHTYELTTNVEGGGYIDTNPDLDEYEHGTEVELTARPDEDEGWYFEEWTGDYTGTAREISLTMTEDREVTAWFEIHTYELEVNINGEGSVYESPAQDEYEHGTEVELTARAEEGWYFEEWTWDVTGTEEEITIVMDEDKEVTANFEKIVYDLTIDVEGQGSTNPSEGSYTHEHGEEVTVSATPEEGWYFEEWTGDVPAGEGDEITITMDEDKEITAHFEIYTYELTIEIEGEGSTTPSEGTHTYEHGEEVTIGALPDENWGFQEWTGDRTSLDGEITLSMDEDKFIRAHFEELEPYFEVQILGYEDEVAKGEEITIEYRVENTGDGTGTQDIVLYLGGERVEVHTGLELGAGEVYEGEFTLDAEDSGEHDFEVSSGDTSDGVMMTIEDDGFLSNYWWLIVVLLIGIIAAAVLIFVMGIHEEGEEDEEEEEEAPFGHLPAQDESIDSDTTPPEPPKKGPEEDFTGEPPEDFSTESQFKND